MSRNSSRSCSPVERQPTPLLRLPWHAKKGAMGDLTNGINRQAQNRWLAERHVHSQSPCQGCWARYLCSGGCHHEVIARGRPACDYIRGWLAYCLEAYSRLVRRRPDYFGSLELAW